MCREVGTDIGKTISAAHEFDVWDDDTGWGKTLRVLIKIDIT